MVGTVQSVVTTNEFGRFPEEGSYEFEQRQGQFLNAIDPEVLTRFQPVSAELEKIEQRMREVDFDGLYHAHLKARVEKNSLREQLLRKRLF